MIDAVVEKLTVRAIRLTSADIVSTKSLVNNIQMGRWNEAYSSSARCGSTA
jgi:hypothetical protein